MHHGLRHVLAASVVGISLFVASAWLSGCSMSTTEPSFDCTLMAGAQGLDLFVVPGSAGAYDIVVRGDDVEADCPYTVDAGLEVTWGTCKVRAGSVTAGMGWGAGTEAAVTVLGADGQPPQQVTVQVYGAGTTLLVEQTLQPEYSESYPNGKRCDRVPYQYAAETIEVP